MIILALVFCFAPSLAQATEDDVPSATIPPDDSTVEAYVQALLKDHWPTEVELEIARTLYGFQVEIEALAARVDAVESADLKQVRELLKEEEAMEDRLDAYEDTLEASARAGAFSKELYRVFDDESERIDDELDALEDKLEQYWDD